MRTIDDPKKSALIWAALGVVTAPSFLFVWSWARLQSFSPDGDDYVVAYLLGYLALLILAFRAFRRAVNFGRRDFTWTHHAGRIFTVFTVIFVLEIVNHISWNLSDFLSGIARRANVFEFPIPIGGYTYFASMEEIITVFILLLTLPLSLRLIDAYFDFLNGWVAAIAETFKAEETSQREESAETEAKPSISQVKSAIEDFEATAIAAITRADLKSYAGMAGIVLSVAMSIIGFIYVFQTSATTRATQIVDAIERTPIAFSGDFFDVAKDLREISERLTDSKEPTPKLVEPVTLVQNIDANEPVLSQVFVTAKGKAQRIDVYLSTLISRLQNVGEVEGTLTAEGEAFLAQLRNVRSEISDTSRTNWDTILLRTAIIVMALVAVKIFHSIMMAASKERYIWENKLAAMSAVRDGSLVPEQVSLFLALQSDGRLEGVDVATDPLPVDLNKLVEKLIDRFGKN